MAASSSEEILATADAAMPAPGPTETSRAPLALPALPPKLPTDATPQQVAERDRLMRARKKIQDKIREQTRAPRPRPDRSREPYH